MAQEIFGATSRLDRKDAQEGEFAFVTEEALPYGEILSGLESLKRLDVEILSTIRIGNL